MTKIFTKFSLLFIGLMLCAGNAWAESYPHDNDANPYYEVTENGITYRIDYTYSSQTAGPFTSITRTITSTIYGNYVARIVSFNSALPYVFIGKSYIEFETNGGISTKTAKVPVCIPKGTFVDYSGMIFLPSWDAVNATSNVYYSGEGDAIPVYSETFGENAHVMVYTNSDLSEYSNYYCTFFDNAVRSVNVWNGHLTVFPSGDVPDVEHEGDFGANNALHWTYYSDKTLAVTANDPNTPAAMPDLAWNGSPAWKAANNITINDIAAVYIGSGVTRIGNFSFYDMSYGHVVSVTFADNSVTSIGNSAFYGAGFSSIELPSNLATIGEYAFSQCDNLTTVTLPASVTAIGEYAFQGSDALQTVIVEATTPPTHPMEGNPIPSIFENISTIVIPDETVCDYKDAWGYSLGGSYVYKYSAGGDAVECAAQTYGTCGTNLNWSIDGGVLTISGTGTTMDNFSSNARPWEDHIASITSVVIEAANMTNIGNYAFYNCTNLSTITVAQNSSLATFGSNALKNCPITNVIRTNTRIIKMPTSYSGAYEIPNGTVEIAAEAFSDCQNLTGVTIPNTVTTIGDYAFYNCTNANFTTIVIPNSVTSFGTSVFRYSDKLTSVTLPSGITTIPDNTFSGCSSLTSVEIPNAVTTIGQCAFQNCTSLATITIPASVSTVDKLAFKGCTSLATLHMGGSAPEMVENYQSWTETYTYVFDGCGDITMYVPAGMLSSYQSAYGDATFGANSLTIVEEEEEGCVFSDEEASSTASKIDDLMGQTLEEVTTIRPVQLNSQYNTLCLPFSMDADQIANSTLVTAEIYEFANAAKNGEYLDFHFRPVTTIQAGVPYFIRYTQEGDNLTGLDFENVTITTATAGSVTRGDVTLIGTLSQVSISGADKLYLSANNTLYYSSTPKTIKPFRAYFSIAGVGPNYAPKARIVERENVATDIENAQSSAISSQKTIENGQLFIIKNGVKYNAQGQIVK